MNPRIALVFSIAAGFSSCCVNAKASSTWIKMDRNPYDATAFTLSVAGKHLKNGSTALTIKLHSAQGKLPHFLEARLAEIEHKAYSFSSIPKRKLALVAKNKDLIATFTITPQEAEKQSFELDWYGEAGGHPMPSVSGYYFPLKNPGFTIVFD